MMATDITDAYVPCPEGIVCPDCGNAKPRLFDNFTWVCPDCGWKEKAHPEDWLSIEELIDWKAGMWTPRTHKRTSLLISWQTMVHGQEIEGGVIAFDSEDRGLKEWLVKHLIHEDGLFDGELRFQLYDAKEVCQ